MSDNYSFFDDPKDKRTIEPSKRKGSMPRSGYFTGSESGNNEATIDDLLRALRQGVDNTGIVPGVEGFIRGRSLGLIDPAASALEAVVTQQPYSTVRSKNLERQKAVEAQNPISSTTGQILGGITAGVKDLPRASNWLLPNASQKLGGVPMRMAEQGLQGGVTYAAQNPDADPRMTAGVAGVSSAIPLVGAGGSALLREGANFVDKAGVIRSLKTIKGFLDDASPSATESLARIFPNVDKSQVRKYATQVLTASEDALTRVPARVAAGEFQDAELLKRLATERDLHSGLIPNIVRSVGTAVSSQPLSLTGAGLGFWTDPGEIQDKLLSAAKYGAAGYGVQKAGNYGLKTLVGKDAPYTIADIMAGREVPASLTTLIPKAAEAGTSYVQKRKGAERPNDDYSFFD